MSILINDATRIVAQGITGNQGRFDTKLALAYGARVVAGMTPGRGGETVYDVPVYDTVLHAVTETGADAAVLYVPAGGVRDAVVEAVEAGCKVILATAENVPRHDAVHAVAVARNANAWLVGFNTNDLISPGKCKLGGIGGNNPMRSITPVGLVWFPARAACRPRFPGP